MATRGIPRWPLLNVEAAALPPAESLVLDAMRHWAASREPMPSAALVLAAGGAEALAVPLDALLRCAGIAPACPLCPSVSRDEAALLAAIALAQHGDRSSALAMLGQVAPPIAAYRAMGAVLSMAGGLAHAGHALAHPFRPG